MPITAVTKEIKTLWAGRAWLDAKYLNQAKNTPCPLIIKYKGETMRLAPEDLKEAFDRSKMVDNKFPPYTQRKQYGVVWTPNKKTEK